MKAAVLVHQNSPLEICDVDIPKLDVGQVLVKMHYAGVCGKQIDEITGRQGADPHLPHLLGHEGSGVVHDVGPGVRKVRPGDGVVLHWMKGSGIESAPPRFKCLGREISAGWVTTFSEYTIASENRMTPIPLPNDFEVMAMLGCAIPTGFGIVFRQAQMSPGQSILVIGCGGVGLSVIGAAKLIHATTIVAIDKNQKKIDMADQMGVDDRINSADVVDLKATIKDIAPKGFDVVVDATGVSALRQIAYEATSNTGITILAGVPYVDQPLMIDSFPLHFGRRIVGSHGGDTVPDVDIPRYYSLFERGWTWIGEMISDRYLLEDINTAISRLACGEIVGRCLIDCAGTNQ